MQRVLDGVRHRLSLSPSDDHTIAASQPTDHSRDLGRHHLFRKRHTGRKSAAGSPSAPSQPDVNDGYADGHASGVAAVQTRQQYNATALPEESGNNYGAPGPSTPSPGPPDQAARSRSSLRSASVDRYSLRSSSLDRPSLRSGSAGRGSLDASEDMRQWLQEPEDSSPSRRTSSRFTSLSPEREQFFTVSRPDGQRRPSMGTRPSPPGSRPSWHSPGRRSSSAERPGQWQHGAGAGLRASSPGERPPLLGSGQPRASGSITPHCNLSPERMSREHAPFEMPSAGLPRSSRTSLDDVHGTQSSLSEERRRSSLAGRHISLAAPSGSPERVLLRPNSLSSPSSPGNLRSASSSSGRHVSISPEVKRVDIGSDGRGIVSTERVSIGDCISRDRRPTSTAAAVAGSSDERRASIAQRPHTSRRSVTLSKALQHSGGNMEPELPDFLRDPNMVLNDPGPWRNDETPNYDSANRKFDAERSVFHPPGTVEDQVTCLVKSWEREASHKINAANWRTVDASRYTFSCNGGQKYSADEMAEMGTYNALIGEHAFYSAKHTNFEESHAVFKKAMPNGFAWEVVELYSGPPVVAFKWRHWGEMTGPLRCPMGHGSTITAPATNANIEIWGVAVAHVNAECRITNLEIFYDPHELMAQLTNSRNFSSAEPVHIPQPLGGASFHPDDMNADEVSFSPASDFQSHKSGSLDVPSQHHSEDSLESHFSDDFYFHED